MNVVAIVMRSPQFRVNRATRLGSLEKSGSTSDVGVYQPPVNSGCDP